MLMADRRTLTQRFHRRANALWAMRLALATVVALVHVRVLGWQDQPALGETELGQLAVDGFFVISGFLVTRSAVRLRSVRRFAWHRALRILPGFWVCLVVTAFVAAPAVALLRGRSPWSVLTGPDSAPAFVLNNAALLLRQWEVAGLPGPLREEAMNGSLWSLFYEAVCYLVVGVLLTARLLGHRPPRRGHPLIVAAAATWAVLVLQESGVHVGGMTILPTLALPFLLGAIGHDYGHRIRFTTPRVLLALAVLAASTPMEQYRLLGAVPFAYLVLWLMVSLPVRIEPRVDLSYGMYVYHWPVTLVLVEAGGAALGYLPLLLLALAVTTALSALSWHLVEAPALRLKDASWVDRPILRRQSADEPS